MAELLKGGHAVTVLHRKPKHTLGRKVKNLIADRNDPKAMKAALAGKSFEVVFDNVYDWQRGTTAAQVEGTVRTINSSLDRYILCPASRLTAMDSTTTKAMPWRRCRRPLRA